LVINNTETNVLNFVCWNVSSIKPDTFKTIRFLQPHVICMQETRGFEFKNSPSFNYIYKKRNNNTQTTHIGGGICIGLSS
jgi:exonuclease III